MQPNSVCLPRPSTQGHGRSGPVARFFTMLLTKLVDWQERAEQRHHLAGMDERMRKDIGISHADALREADKPFWKA